jgi:hypothetical protein
MALAAAYKFNICNVPKLVFTWKLGFILSFSVVCLFAGSSLPSLRYEDYLEFNSVQMTRIQ